jgi:hypothetical protein
VQADDLVDIVLVNAAASGLQLSRNDIASDGERIFDGFASQR